ncbi:hypothetical protein DVDV_0084 [Desulfovibrio sp. DV]|nr:hypothetical protein DVDV_0084 [Desulfovibrio sp. DV]
MPSAPPLSNSSATSRPRHHCGQATGRVMASHTSVKPEPMRQSVTKSN